jgi:hemerythrin
MELLTWNESFRVEIKSVDIQHQKWFEIINRLDKINQCKECDNLKNILEELLKFTETHFKYEEIYFEKFNFSGSENHKNEHKVFIERLLSYKVDVDNGTEILSDEVMQFIRDWVINHVKETDHGYIQNFHKNGFY